MSKIRIAFEDPTFVAQDWTDVIADILTGRSLATVTGWMTTDHARSSYGQPLVVTDDGREWGVLELQNTSIYIISDEADTLQYTRETPSYLADLVQAAKDAGFVVMDRQYT